MQSCFVSIPFGKKQIHDGRVLDFFHIFRDVIKPTVEGAGFQTYRFDDFSALGFGQKQLLSAVISSDIMIADITYGNPNVFYELGVRHALRRGRTILISAIGGQPSYISVLSTVFYRPNDDGRLTGPPADEFRSQLQAKIQQIQRTTVIDSPVFDAFPDLEVTLPPELQQRPRRLGPRLTKQRQEFVQAVVESPDQARGDLEESRAAFRGSDVSPATYLELMKRFRNLSEWDGVVDLADNAPPDVADSPEVRNMLALALNRRNGPGDQDRAISVMEQQIVETGGDSESFGILGRIYKDRYDQAKDRGDAAEASENLEKALENYRKGFDKNPRDYYPGINVVNLLLQRGDDAAQQELSVMVPRVSAVVQEKLVGDRVDFWDLATDLQLATVARDWLRAEQRANAMMAQAPPRWMMETTLRDMRAVGKTFDDENDKHELDRIVRLLQSPEPEIGGVA